MLAKVGPQRHADAVGADYALPVGVIGLAGGEAIDAARCHLRSSEKSEIYPRFTLTILPVSLSQLLVLALSNLTEFLMNFTEEKIIKNTPPIFIWGGQMRQRMLHGLEARATLGLSCAIAQRKRGVGCGLAILPNAYSLWSMVRGAPSREILTKANAPVLVDGRVVGWLWMRFSR